MKTLALTNEQFRTLKRVVNTVDDCLDIIPLDEWASDETMDGAIFNELVKIVNRKDK